jgi:hypothetical protein
MPCQNNIENTEQILFFFLVILGASANYLSEKEEGLSAKKGKKVKMLMI